MCSCTIKPTDLSKIRVWKGEEKLSKVPLLSYFFFGCDSLSMVLLAFLCPVMKQNESKVAFSSSSILESIHFYSQWMHKRNVTYQINERYGMLQNLPHFLLPCPRHQKKWARFYFHKVAFEVPAAQLNYIYFLYDLVRSQGKLLLQYRMKDLCSFLHSFSFQDCLPSYIHTSCTWRWNIDVHSYLLSLRSYMHEIAYSEIFRRLLPPKI